MTNRLYRFLAPATCLALLTGCSSTDVAGTVAQASAEAQNTAIPFNPGSSTTTTDSGTHYFSVGDTANTQFFDVTVYSAETYASIYEEEPAEGNKYLVIDATVKNTTSSEITMFDTDFYIYYGSGDSDYAVPITTDLESWSENPNGMIVSDQLPYDYDLAAGESRDGYLIFEVPTNTYDYLFVTSDSYSDGTYGDDYVFELYEISMDRDYAMDETADTYFYDLKVNGATATASYNGLTAAAGNTFVVVDVTITNDFGSDLQFGIYEFYLALGDYSDAYTSILVDEDNDWNEMVENNVSDAMIPYEFEIAAGQSLTGELVYEVPTGSLFYLYFYDNFSDDTVGDYYFVEIDL